MIGNSGRRRIITVSAAFLAAGLMSVMTMPSGASAQGEELKGNIRFTWWGSTTRNQKTEQIIKLFEQANPGVTITAEPGEWNSYWDKLTIQAASGNQPCSLTMQSRWLNQYADPQILKPLDDMVASGELDTSGVAKSVIDSARGPDGKLYFIPSGVFYFVLFMNKTEIEKVGMQLPPNDWTWDDYAAFVTKLAKKLPQGTYASGDLGNLPDAFTNWVQSHGEKLFAADGSFAVSKKAITEYFNYWENLRKAGATEPADKMAEIPDNIIDDTLLAKGQIAIDARPANQLDAHQRVLNNAKPGEELMIHTYPVGPSGAGDDIGTNGFAIGAKCDDNDSKIAAAWSNFFLENEQAADIYLSDNGVVSVDKFQEKQANDSKLTEGQRQLVKVFQVVAPRAQPAYYPRGGYQALNQALASNYEAVAFGKLTPDAGADAMIKQIQSLMR
jgi:multiple sugar transport system substrate-binding protein